MVAPGTAVNLILGRGLSRIVTGLFIIVNHASALLTFPRQGGRIPAMLLEQSLPAGHRVPGRPWIPGQSGNPSGLAAVDRDLRAIFRAATPKMARELIRIALGRGRKYRDASIDLRMRAMIAVVEHGIGRPPQAISGIPAGGVVVIVGSGWDETAAALAIGLAGTPALAGPVIDQPADTPGAAGRRAARAAKAAAQPVVAAETHQDGTVSARGVAPPAVIDLEPEPAA